MTGHRSILRFRRREADRAGEDSRLASVRAAVGVALSNLESELKHLSSRLELNRAWAGCLLGTEDGSRFVREASDERRLCQAEEQIKLGAERISRLRDDHRFLLQIKAVLERRTPSLAS